MPKPVLDLYDNHEQQQQTTLGTQSTQTMRRLLGKSSPAAVYESVTVTAPSRDENDDDAEVAVATTTTIDMTSTNREGGSTIGSGVINLTNTIVGAGMLGLPGAMGSTGWLSGILIIVISAAFSAHGLVLLSKAACLTGRPSSFYSVALASVPRFTILIDAAVALKCFGVATGMIVLPMFGSLFSKMIGRLWETLTHVLFNSS